MTGKDENQMACVIVLTPILVLVSVMVCPKIVALWLSLLVWALLLFLREYRRDLAAMLSWMKEHTATEGRVRSQGFMDKEGKK